MEDPFIEKVQRYMQSKQLANYNTTEINSMIDRYNNDEESKEIIRMIFDDLVVIYDNLDNIQISIDDDKRLDSIESWFPIDTYSPSISIEKMFEYGDTSGFFSRIDAMMLYDVLHIIDNLTMKGIIDIEVFDYIDSPLEFVVDEVIQEIKDRIREDTPVTDWAIREAIKIKCVGWEIYVQRHLERRGIIF